MQKNKQFINALIFILGVFLVIFFFHNEKDIRRLLHWPYRFTSIGNRDSELLVLLLDEDSFPIDYAWDSIAVSQSDVSPVPITHNLIEEAFVVFGGSNSQSDLTVTHWIFRYDSIPIWLDEVSVQPRNPSSLVMSDSFSIGINVIGDAQSSRCFYYTNSFTECRIISRYSWIDSEIIIVYKDIVDRNTIEDNVNYLLEALEKKFNQIER